MTVGKNKIGLITTVSNWELYNKTIKFFPPGIKIFAIDGTKGLFGLESMLFFMRKLRKYNLEWVIMADEDVIFTDHEKIFNLIEYLNFNNYTACGMRDGGVLSWRDQNPFLINTFFTILNLQEIYPIYKEEEILNNQHINKGEFREEEVDFLPYNYHKDSLFEPYYCFFLWLVRKGKKLKFLHGYNPKPNETTVLLDHKGEQILIHTWYARLYKKDKGHTERIAKALLQGKPVDAPLKPIIFKDHSFHLKKTIWKLTRRIKNRVIFLFKKMQ